MQLQELAEKALERYSVRAERARQKLARKLSRTKRGRNLLEHGPDFHVFHKVKFELDRDTLTKSKVLEPIVVRVQRVVPVKTKPREFAWKRYREKGIKYEGGTGKA